MATRSEANAVYAAGLVQGIVLVTFPAASTIFTDPSEYDLSSTQYGTMFLPQVLTAITASVLAGSLARRFGTKRVYLAGLVADLASMVLLILSQSSPSARSSADRPGVLRGADRQRLQPHRPVHRLPGRRRDHDRGRGRRAADRHQRRG
jgi:MFS family permease